MSATEFLNELTQDRPESDASRQMSELLKKGLANCASRDEQGRMTLSFTLPDSDVLNRFAESLARILIR